MLSNLRTIPQDEKYEFDSTDKKSQIVLVGYKHTTPHLITTSSNTENYQILETCDKPTRQT